MPDLGALFGSIQSGPPPASGNFAGAPIPATPHHIAKDSRGRPAVLLAAQPTDVRPASIILENLRIEHGLRCRISQPPDRQLDDRFSVIQCQSEDPILQRCFLDLCSTILGELDANPTQRSIADNIDRMALLFRAMEQPSQRSVQGLWGELLLIVHSRDPLALAQAWHNDACERYDFAAGEQRLEVKTCADRSRVHFFSQEQTNPATDVQCVVVSVFTEVSTGGRTLGSVWDESRALVGESPELRARLDEVSFSALGSSWREARLIAYDEQLALSSLMLYDVRDIPRIEATPDGVTDIRFRSNLTLGRTLQSANRPTLPLVELLRC
jgi:hypothetical protein